MSSKRNAALPMTEMSERNVWAERGNMLRRGRALAPNSLMLQMTRPHPRKRANPRAKQCTQRAEAARPAAEQEKAG
jgi:hypothetical protein